jgi:hypothetical protein
MKRLWVEKGTMCKKLKTYATYEILRIPIILEKEYP